MVLACLLACLLAGDLLLWWSVCIYVTRLLLQVCMYVLYACGAWGSSIGRIGWLSLCFLSRINRVAGLKKEREREGCSMNNKIMSVQHLSPSRDAHCSVLSEFNAVSVSVREDWKAASCSHESRVQNVNTFCFLDCAMSRKVRTATFPGTRG